MKGSQTLGILANFTVWVPGPQYTFFFLFLNILNIRSAEKKSPDGDRRRHDAIVLEGEGRTTVRGLHAALQVLLPPRALSRFPDARGV